MAAVEAKQIAKQNGLTEQNNIAKQETIKQQTIINAEAEAEEKKIEAQGEAEAIRLKQAAIAQNPLIIQYEFVQRLSDRGHELAAENAEQLPLDACRVRERAQQIEDGAGAEFSARRRDMTHRRVMMLCEQEGDPGLAQASLERRQVGFCIACRRAGLP